MVYACFDDFGVDYGPVVLWGYVRVGSGRYGWGDDRVYVEHGERARRLASVSEAFSL
jgi:hypothetical protein